jgi:DNA topoisomerase-3
VRFTIKEDAEQFLERIKNEEFEIISFTKKKGAEAPPRLFDLTSLQVECNRKFGFTADETLQHIQKLYERKLVSYPRVDTTFLPNDMYPKIKGILEKLKPYENFTQKLLSEPIKKSKKVFDDKKITDHHAIVPTGIMPSGLVLTEKQVYDTITRRFIAVFYPDCIVSNTTVIGEVAEVEFKATGKIILEPGWRELYPKKEVESSPDEGQIMPEFVKGEHGEHFPDLQEKQTQPPKQYTEATLLRAMETAGKQVDDEELSELMKENGIGRPSTRANIIETLFKRNYVIRERKNLIPTITGIQLIETIQNELLKSVELTGQWEKKLRLIENGEYDVKLFLEEMKTMVSEVVQEVKQENRQLITIEENLNKSAVSSKQSAVSSLQSTVSSRQFAVDSKNSAVAKHKADKKIPCPKCKNGTVLKGNNAFGCSEYKAGCNFKVVFEQFGKKLTDTQLQTLIEKGKTAAIAGFMVKGVKSKGTLLLKEDFTVDFVMEATPEKPQNPAKVEPKELTCPKCNTGTMLKGRRTAGSMVVSHSCIGFISPRPL